MTDKATKLKFNFIVNPKYVTSRCNLINLEFPAINGIAISHIQVIMIDTTKMQLVSGAFAFGLGSTPLKRPVGSNICTPAADVM